MNDCSLKIVLSAAALLTATAALAQPPVAASAQREKDVEGNRSAKVAAFSAPAIQPWDAEDTSTTSAGGVRTMPAYRVTEFRAEVFREFDLYTKMGREDLSFQRHPGLLIGNPFKLNEGVAYETFLRDNWNSTKSDYRDMAHAMALGGDPGEGRMIVKAIDDEDVRMRGDAADAAAPSIGRFQIASAETGTKLLELPEEAINIPFIRKKW